MSFFRSRSIRFASRGAFIIALGVAAAAAPGQPKPSPGADKPAEVPVVKPEVREINEFDDYTGRLAAVETVEIRPRVAGTIDKVLVADGKEVKKGDLLFVIDQRPYQVELQRAEAELARNQARLDVAKSEAARGKSLAGGAAISGEEAQKRVSGEAEAAAAVGVAKAAVASARLNMEFTEIKAPVSGMMSRAELTQGNLVTAGTLLTTIVTIDPIYCYVDVDENAILKYARLKAEGKRTSARDVAIPALLAVGSEGAFETTGTIDFVDNRVNSQTGTLRARGVFPNPDRRLLPGLFARVRVDGSGRYKATLIPDRALGSDQGTPFVFTIGADGTAKQTRVKTGPLLEGKRIVREGLTGDEQVITDGILLMRPGNKVVAKKAGPRDASAEKPTAPAPAAARKPE